MIGLVGNYNQVPRMRAINSRLPITPVAGSNPVDLGDVSLPNTRGQLTIIGEASDTNVRWTFQVTGGFGEYPGVYTRNFAFIPGSTENCTVLEVSKNFLRITTDVADAGGRVYDMRFNPIQSVGPTIRQTSVNIVGNNTLTIQLNKVFVVEGF
jgi:hypothetical protein